MQNIPDLFFAEALQAGMSKTTEPRLRTHRSAHLHTHGVGIRGSYSSSPGKKLAREAVQN
jgi:hypothetical protein